MKRLARLLAIVVVGTSALAQTGAIFGFLNQELEREREKQFLAVPDPMRAREHLRTLTAAPHIAGSAEDRITADYVAAKFREAGLDTEIIEYKVWLNYPVEVSVDIVTPARVEMHGPSREWINGDPFQDDPRVVTAFNANSPSGDVEADVVYANYGRPEDLAKLKEMNVDVRGKILLVRYGQNYRGVKVLLAEEHGAAGVIIYSDPLDDGWSKGDKYPRGPWRPDTAVQRGSVGYSFKFAGDATTPGIASLPSLPDAQRTPAQQSRALPKIPATPLSYADTAPILENLGGPVSPREWQGALPFTYHVGPGPVRIKMHLKQDYAYRTIWDVTGTIRGREAPDEWVVAGNHRDAWVYGAADPGSGTAAMLEAIHGIGELLKLGWKPRRTIVFGSWDGEEYGLIGSTEWGEQHARELGNAAAYFNTDIAVSGPNFSAACVGSLKPFMRDVAKAVPSPAGGSVYDAWVAAGKKQTGPGRASPEEGYPTSGKNHDVHVGDLGSGSDYTVFLDHLGVPSCDIGSTGPYGVYHSVFDNFAWFEKFGDPKFVYEQQQARVLGLQVLRMAAADVLPYDFEEYGKEITAHLKASRTKADTRFGINVVNFTAAEAAAARLVAAGAATGRLQREFHSVALKSGAAGLLSSARADPINRALRQAERALLLPAGLPRRPWYRHAIYAPGEYSGYAAMVLPGVNEAIERGDLTGTREQLAELAVVLARAAEALSSEPVKTAPVWK